MKLFVRRSGFTLVELLVVMAVGSLLLMVVYQVLSVQLRSFRQQQELISSRQVARTALDLLTSELREVSATGNDLVVASAGAVRFRAYRKVGIVCDPGGFGVPFEIVELHDPFVENEDVVVFADRNITTTSDDGWVFARVGPTGSGSCTLGDDWTSRSVTLYSFGGLAGVRPGAPVRSYEWMTYGHYEVDGEWVLGRRGPNDVTPVALVGPLAPPRTGGLVFRYFDENGNEMATPVASADLDRIRSIAVEVRSMDGPGGAVSDSLVTRVQLRGNAWQ